MKVSTVLLGVLVVCAASRTTAQTLAEVARAEQERRKAVGAAAKVYTNGSLKAELPPASPPMPVQPAPGAASTATAQAGSPAATPEAAAKASPAVPAVPAGPATPAAAALPTTEDGWRTRITGLRQTLARNQVLADALQSRIDALWMDFVNRDDPAQRSVVETNRNTALKELDRMRSEIKDGQKAVTDLEELARRAGVPAGWLR